MPIKLNTKFLDEYIQPDEYATGEDAAAKAHEMLHSGTGPGSEFLGWIDLPVDYDKDEFLRIKQAAQKIQETSDVLIVIGIGGSYLGARAVIEALRGKYATSKPQIIFVGNSLSSNDLESVIELCEGKDVSVNVISKSGTTTEPAIAFRIFRKLLETRYGLDGAKDRIYVTTDKEKGALKELSNQNNYESFVIPDNIGGRYSVLTAVGLLPIAVAGINIEELMFGAAKAREDSLISGSESNTASKYAIYRNVLYEKGFSIEILANYEPCLSMLNEWWKQLFGESEGKDGLGIFPASVTYTTDLHSMGQYIQEGRRNLFETVISIGESSSKILIPDDESNSDGLGFLSNKELAFANQKALEGTVVAHTDGGVPNIILDIPELNEYELGYLIYFFEKSCAISGYMLGVNPFDQPGVEAYKKNMFALLGKPGFEDLRDKLNKRLGE